MKLFNDRCSHDIETSQLICFVNQLTGFYMMGTLVVATLRQCPTLWTEIVAGRKCCEENLATFATFFPQQYNFSHFASFSSRNLQSKSSIHQK